MSFYIQNGTTILHQDLSIVPVILQGSDVTHSFCYAIHNLKSHRSWNVFRWVILMWTYSEPSNAKIIKCIMLPNWVESFRIECQYFLSSFNEMNHVWKQHNWSMFTMLKEASVLVKFSKIIFWFLYIYNVFSFEGTQVTLPVFLCGAYYYVTYKIDFAVENTGTEFIFDYSFHNLMQLAKCSLFYWVQILYRNEIDIIKLLHWSDNKESQGKLYTYMWKYTFLVI